MAHHLSSSGAKREPRGVAAPPAESQEFKSRSTGKAPNIASFFSVATDCNCQNLWHTSHLINIILKRAEKLKQASEGSNQKSGEHFVSQVKRKNAFCSDVRATKA